MKFLLRPRLNWHIARKSRSELAGKYRLTNRFEQTAVDLINPRAAR